jgi:hypothetical protein
MRTETLVVLVSPTLINSFVSLLMVVLGDFLLFGTVPFLEEN